ncbi:unnamed protein product [Rhizoctonia solani]|uniref:Uncharacterized protein n=1 Tax=Rhizoctonia solani TaxID=456999 RepID=A0A8H3HL86_9AGAM|nr:unnamed protein product [Rhizoctonia solani]
MAPTSAISRIVSSMLAPSLGTNSEQFQQLSEGMSIRPRPTRGLTSCVVDAGSLAPNDAAFAVTYWNNGRTPANKRGKSSSVQTLGSSYVGRMFQVDNEPVLTEEPSSITDTTGTAGGGLGISAQPSCFNAIQALALCQPIPEGSETLKSGTSPQSHAEAKVEIEERGPGYTALREGNTSNEELQVRCPNTDSRSPLAPVYDPPLPRKPLAWRVGTDPVSLLARDTVAKSSVRPHPLRTASTHNSNKAVFRYSSESPLQASLYTGSRIPPLFMLVIAVAYNGLEDPQHDFELLQTWLKNHKSGRICFRGISGEEATREKIEEAIRELYGQALHVHGSKLLILFTGEGDNTNRMHLMGGRFITDTDIRNWLWRVRSEARPASVPITVVLDYCRTNKHIPLTNNFSTVGIA